MNTKRAKNKKVTIDAMIVGAQKSATTGLLTLLGSHPDILIPARNELVFYSKTEEYNRGKDWMDWKYFQNSTNVKRVVAKDINLFRNKLGIERLLADFPRIKLITMIRNPVDRAYSAYLFNKQMGLETSASIEEVVNPKKEESLQYLGEWIALGYLYNGNYVDHINLVNELVGVDNHIILVAEDFFDNSTIVAQKIINILQLNATTLNLDLMNRNTGADIRFAAVNNIINLLKKIPRPLKDTVRCHVGSQRIAKIIARIRKINTVERKKPRPLAPDVKEQLEEYFIQKNLGLKKLVESDVGWLQRYE